MLKIETKYQGELTVQKADVYTFEKGIPGFSDEASFVLLPFAEESPFFILQSVRTPALAFVVTDPFLFFQDYDFTIEEHVISQLQIKEERDVSVLVILTVMEPFAKTTANLQAPIVLNAKNKCGKQIILTDERYTTKHSIMPEAMKED